LDTDEHRSIKELKAESSMLKGTAQSPSASLIKTKADVFSAFE
jgi:hypothetical protein